MYADFFHAFFFRLFNERFQMFDVGVHVSIRQQADEMHRMIFRAFNELFPCRRVEQLFRVDVLVDEFGALRVNLSAADRVVTYFGVSHIAICRKPYGESVRSQFRMRAFVPQFVQMRFVCHLYGVSKLFVANADTVHDNKDHRSFFHVYSS